MQQAAWVVCSQTFRGTGVTVYLENGGTLEKARQMVAHTSARSTQLYDRREDRVTLDEYSGLNGMGSLAQVPYVARVFTSATTDNA